VECPTPQRRLSRGCRAAFASGQNILGERFLLEGPSIGRIPTSHLTAMNALRGTYSDAGIPFSHSAALREEEARPSVRARPISGS